MHTMYVKPKSPLTLCTLSPLLLCHTCTVQSLLPLTTCFPSWLKQASLMMSVCPFMYTESCSLGQRRMRPWWSWEKTSNMSDWWEKLSVVRDFCSFEYLESSVREEPLLLSSQSLIWLPAPVPSKSPWLLMVTVWPSISWAFRQWMGLEGILTEDIVALMEDIISEEESNLLSSSSMRSMSS